MGLCKNMVEREFCTWGKKIKVIIKKDYVICNP